MGNFFVFLKIDRSTDELLSSNLDHGTGGNIGSTRAGGGSEGDEKFLECQCGRTGAMEGKRMSGRILS
tara:strand:+ start:224 stop:427 length:204 start_codon:yes stop_codon:yes gene_type:complete